MSWLMEKACGLVPNLITVGFYDSSDDSIEEVRVAAVRADYLSGWV